MRNLGIKTAVAVLAALALALATYTIKADEDDELILRAHLSGFEEVGQPVLAPNATPATGEFRARLSEDGTTLTYKLTWTPNLLTSPILFAHIHFAMPGVNGAIMTFLCGGGTKPACTGGVATGTITLADIGPLAANQLVVANDFTDFLRVIRAGDAYVNLHTTKFPGGEIRGQIHVRHDRE